MNLEASNERGAGEGLVARTAGDAVAESIRAAILGGKLAPGARLRESALARELKVSRTPVREALRTLATDGLVIAMPNRGTVVRSYALDELDEMYRLRALLEGYAARCAASSSSPEDIERLRLSAERFSRIEWRAENLTEHVNENAVFHSIIMEMAQSPRLAEMVHSVTQVLLIFRSYTWYSVQQRKAIDRTHSRLVDAIASHDGERAEGLMKEHIYQARDVLLGRMRAEHTTQ